MFIFLIMGFVIAYNTAMRREVSLKELGVSRETGDLCGISERVINWPKSVTCSKISNKKGTHRA